MQRPALVLFRRLSVWSALLRDLLVRTVTLFALFAAGCRTEPSDVTVIQSARARQLTVTCPPGRCREVLVDARCDATSDVVVVAGHSMPPLYLDGSPDALAAAVACRRPKLVVLDTCWGASLPLLEALAAKGVHARVIGASFYLPERGLSYGEAFWSTKDPDARAAAITSPHATWPLTNILLEERLIDGWKASLAAMPVTEMRTKLRHTLPNYVVVGDGPRAVVADVPPERFGSPP